MGTGRKCGLTERQRIDGKEGDEDGGGIEKPDRALTLINTVPTKYSGVLEFLDCSPTYV